MNREYHQWWSPRLDRSMELLVFGHAGLPVLTFPTSHGRFHELEDRGLVAAIAHKIEAGRLQLWCLDTLNAESWYNRGLPPRRRILRHLQYENYIIEEVLPLLRARNHHPRLMALGCSFGGYHAVNIALRHPHRFTGFLSMSGAFDLANFFGSYYDQDLYFNLPTHYLPNLADPRYLEPMRTRTYLLATGWDDHCLGENQHLSRILDEKNIPHQLHIWDAANSHDWPTWARMMNEYLD